MHDNEIKRALLADRVGEQFFESLALFQIAERRLAFLKIFFSDLIPVLDRPFATRSELCLD
jgi:hypothetical protein